MGVMALRSPETVQVVGTIPTYHAASSGGDKIAQPTDRVFVHVKNDSASPITVTVVTPGLVLGQPVGDIEEAIPANSASFIGPLGSRDLINSDGEIDLTWSATATVTFAVLRI